MIEEAFPPKSLIWISKNLKPKAKYKDLNSN